MKYLLFSTALLALLSSYSLVLAEETDPSKNAELEMAKGGLYYGDKDLDPDPVPPPVPQPAPPPAPQPTPDPIPDPDPEPQGN